MYLLVEFTDNQELAVIPDNWLEGTRCGLWPPFKSTSRLTRAVVQKEPPSESWKAYPIREMYRNESYDKVRSKLKQAEVESDLQTDQETNDRRPVRRKRSPNRYSSDSENEELVRIRKRPQLPPKNALSTVQEQRLPVPPARISTQDTCTGETSAESHPPPQVLYCRSPGTLLDTLDTRGSQLPVSAKTPPPVVCRSGTRNPCTTYSNSITATPATSVPTSVPIRASSKASRPLLQDRQLGTNIARDVRIFTMLEEIKEEQHNQSTLLRTILTRLGPDGEVDPMPEDISFPITSDSEMASFEEKMKDKNLQKVVVSHLASVGCSSIENMADRILKYAVSNPLAEKYNWTGVNKFAFNKLELTKLLKRSISRTFRLVSSADVEKAVKSFLKSAKDRDGGRRRRMKGKTVASQPAATNTNPDVSSDSDSDN